jgi:hypothetical protein
MEVEELGPGQAKVTLGDGREITIEASMANVSTQWIARCRIKHPSTERLSDIRGMRPILVSAVSEEPLYPPLAARGDSPEECLAAALEEIRARFGADDPS